MNRVRKGLLINNLINTIRTFCSYKGKKLPKPQKLKDEIL